MAKLTSNGNKKHKSRQSKQSSKSRQSKQSSKSRQSSKSSKSRQSKKNNRNNKNNNRNRRVQKGGAGSGINNVSKLRTLLETKNPCEKIIDYIKYTSRFHKENVNIYYVNLYSIYWILYNLYGNPDLSWFINLFVTYDAIQIQKYIDNTLKKNLIFSDCLKKLINLAIEIKVLPYNEYYNSSSLPYQETEEIHKLMKTDEKVFNDWVGSEYSKIQQQGQSHRLQQVHQSQQGIRGQPIQGLTQQPPQPPQPPQRQVQPVNSALRKLELKKALADKEGEDAKKLVADLIEQITKFVRPPKFEKGKGTNFTETYNKISDYLHILRKENGRLLNDLYENTTNPEEKEKIGILYKLYLNYQTKAVNPDTREKVFDSIQAIQIDLLIPVDLKDALKFLEYLKDALPMIFKNYKPQYGEQKNSEKRFKYIKNQLIIATPNFKEEYNKKLKKIIISMNVTAKQTEEAEKYKTYLDALFNENYGGGRPSLEKIEDLEKYIEAVGLEAQLAKLSVGSDPVAPRAVAARQNKVLLPGLLR